MEAVVGFTNAPQSSLINTPLQRGAFGPGRASNRFNGVTEPQATFSPCFGAPFMALPPLTYAQLLGEKIARHNVQVWLVNTGWSGGAYGAGQRMKLAHTRAIVRAILNGDLQNARTRPDPVFGIQVPLDCPGAPQEILDPRRTWKDPAAYDLTATKLAGMFEKNFNENAPDAPPDIRQAGPKTAT